MENKNIKALWMIIFCFSPFGEQSSFLHIITILNPGDKTRCAVIWGGLKVKLTLLTKIWLGWLLDISLWKFTGYVPLSIEHVQNTELYPLWPGRSWKGRKGMFGFLSWTHCLCHLTTDDQVSEWSVYFNYMFNVFYLLWNKNIIQKGFENKIF